MTKVIVQLCGELESRCDQELLNRLQIRDEWNEVFTKKEPLRMRDIICRFMVDEFDGLGNDMRRETDRSQNRVETQDLLQFSGPEFQTSRRIFNTKGESNSHKPEAD